MCCLLQPDCLGLELETVQHLAEPLSGRVMSLMHGELTTGLLTMHTQMAQTSS